MTITADREVLRACFLEGATPQGCLLRIAVAARLARDVVADVVTAATADEPPVKLGRVVLGAGMAANETNAYMKGLWDFRMRAAALANRSYMTELLARLEGKRPSLDDADRKAQRMEMEAGRLLRDATMRMPAVPDRRDAEAQERRWCADAANLQTAIDGLRVNASTLLAQMRATLGAVSAVPCSSPADVQTIRAGWKAGNDLASDLRRVLAEVADKTAQRRQILPELNRGLAARDSADDLLDGQLEALQPTLREAEERWHDAGAQAELVRGLYPPIRDDFKGLEAIVPAITPIIPDWVLALFDELDARDPYRGIREDLRRAAPRLLEVPQVWADTWKPAHDELGRDIKALEARVSAARNALYKRTCDARDHDTLNETRQTAADADVELQKYQGLPAKATECEASLTPPPKPPAAPAPTRLWFEPGTVQVRVGEKVEPKVFAEFDDAPGRAVDVTDRVGWGGGERLPLTITDRHEGRTLQAEVVLGNLAAALRIQVAAAGPPGGTPQAAPTVRLECDGGAGMPTNVLEIEQGQSLRRTCRVIVTGWVSDTADRVFSDVQGLRPGTLDVLPLSDFAPGSQMYRAGVNDAWREYRFSHSFSAPASTAPGIFPLVVIVRQEDSRSGGDRWNIALPLLVNVIPLGASPGTSLAPPAVVRQGSGGQYGVWRYKLFGDPPPCFHFVAAVMGKYGPPGYEQVGANMTFGEADAEIGRLSRYFDDQYGCSAWPRDRQQPPPPPPGAGRRLVNLRFVPPAMTAQVGVELMPRVLALYSDSPTLIDVTGEVRWSGARTRVPVVAFPSEAGITLKLWATLDDQSEVADIYVEEEKPSKPVRQLSRFGFAPHAITVKVGQVAAPKVYLVWADEPDKVIDVTGDPRVKYSGDRVVPFTAQAADAGKTFTVKATFDWASDSATIQVEAAPPITPPITPPDGTGAVWVREPMVATDKGKELTVGESGMSYSYAGNQFGPQSNSLAWSVPPATLREGQEFTLQLSVGHASEWKATRYGFEAGNIAGRWNARCFGTPGGAPGRTAGSWSGVITADSGAADKNSVSKTVVFSPGSATGERLDECYLQINGGAVCSDSCGDFTAVVTWKYKRQAQK